MKKRWKILIVLGFLWIIGSTMISTTPSTTNVYDLTCPSGWEYRGNGNYVDAMKSGHLLVSEADNKTIDEYKTNDTADRYVVLDHYGNSTMYAYAWGATGQLGFFEVVNVNGTDYLFVYSYEVSELDAFEPGDLYGYALLEEFNELNNLEPVQI